MQLFSKALGCIICGILVRVIFVNLRDGIIAVDAVVNLLKYNALASTVKLSSSSFDTCMIGCFAAASSL